MHELVGESCSRLHQETPFRSHNARIRNARLRDLLDRAAPPHSIRWTDALVANLQASRLNSRQSKHKLRVASGGRWPWTRWQGGPGPRWASPNLIANSSHLALSPDRDSGTTAAKPNISCGQTIRRQGAANKVAMLCIAVRPSAAHQEGMSKPCLQHAVYARLHSGFQEPTGAHSACPWLKLLVARSQGTSA